MQIPTQQLQHERRELLSHLNRVTDKPLIALSFVWLGLLVLDLTRGLDPLLQTITNGIWAIFIADFMLEFVIAPGKIAYLRANWLTALSLILPAFRILRIFQALRFLRLARAARTVGLLRILTSINRGMRATANTLGKRNVGYVIAATIMVTFVGAAGMAVFESPGALQLQNHPTPEMGLKNYSEAVWWTAMLMTTIGSDYWPQTVEGRILCWLLSVYALAVFGYITAAVASHFVGKDQSKELEKLQAQRASPEPDV
jgi:voltage-gated potassium channel